MRKLILSFILLFSSFSPALAEEMSVTDKLEQRKADFTEKADAQKIADYDEGVRLVAESGVLDEAKNVGDQAPDFTLPNAVGENVVLSDLLAKGPVVMIWYRGEWCPYCNIYLEDIQAHIEEFKAAGAEVVAISPEQPDGGWALQDKLALEFHVLSDDQSKVAQEYGVAYKLPPKIAMYYQDAFDLHGKNADDSDILPLAASYVIGQDGKIVYAYLDPDYRKRAETKELLKVVQELQASAQTETTSE